MHPKCRAAVNQAAGKTLTDAQIQKIDDRMSETMRRLAREDPKAWMATPPDQRMVQAALKVQGDIQAEAARKVDNAQRQALKTAELETRLQSYTKRQGGNRAKALTEDMNLTNSYIDGIKRDASRQLMDLIEAAKSMQDTSLGRKGLMALFDAQNPKMSQDLAMEVFAQGKGATGNKLAQDGAKAWLEVIEGLRQRFNSAGGDVRQLDYGYLPQAHDQGRVRATGQEAWAGRVLPLLDRSRYLREDGSRMTDAEVLDFLRASWETIATDGMNKTAPGQFKGVGARANAGSQSREIHFKNGASYLEYQKQFGMGSMYDAMIGHIGGMSRNIGLVERYGPNPESQMRLQFDLAERADGEKKRVFGNRPEAYWRVLNGASGMAESARIAQVAQDVRNIEVFGKLQGAVLSSLTDLPTYFVTAGYNKLGYWESLKSIGKAMTPDTREFLNMHGMIAESMISDLNRWSGENIRQNWSGRVANSTMKLSLMNAWTDTLRRAFSLTMMNGVAKLSRVEWGRLSEYDRWRMENKGLTEQDWNVIRAAQLDRHRGADMLTPDAIYATGDARAGEIVAKYIGLITDESEVAILNPDLATRAITSGGAASKGTVMGETARAVAQFKSFPIAMISRHWRRMLETPQGLEGAPVLANRAAYSVTMMVTLTALGAMAFQTKQIVSGKDPVDMTQSSFWARALAQGGGLGFFGDLILEDTTDAMSRTDPLFRLLGPSFGSLAEVYSLTKGNIDEMVAGEDTNAGAEAIRFARGHLPLINLWYAKQAVNGMGLHALQEAASPGYLARIKNKARKDWGQEYWWQPGDSLPDRAPDFGAALGD
ncbi:hypothetical protein M8A51_23580 [Schlegelella sp. S2-27]|uniref:Phage protein n=1 Tax=Caldimonas mangrovi TaxID=2944811 RepID=A0ABT0YUU5_9BURK|nr:hypothetical protein [Caldimonas mangrovi]MCM5682522.1 hypothetical protein [Caldimonas mangrovi]